MVRKSRKRRRGKQAREPSALSHPFTKPTKERLNHGKITKGRGGAYREDWATEIDRWFDLGYLGADALSQDRYDAGLKFLELAYLGNLSRVPSSNYTPRVSGKRFDLESYERELVRQVLQFLLQTSIIVDA